MDTAPGLGKLLRDARLRLGMTQQQVGDALGLEKSEISAFEVGRRRWPQEHVRALSRVLGLRQVDMAVAAGLIDPPEDLPPAPVVDFRLREIVDNWARLREPVRLAWFLSFRQLLADEGSRAPVEDGDPVIAVAR